MKNKFIIIIALLAFVVSISCLFGYQKKVALADEITDIDCKSKCAYLIDANSNTVIYAKNENQKMPIASMCKVMTLLICFDEIKEGKLKEDEFITVSKNASSMGGSQVFLEENGQYKTSELIKSIVVASANDACVAIAERICGSEQGFVDLMNKKAEELNMKNTVFVNCTGLPKPGQHSSAKDVSIMFSELIKHDNYFNYSKIWMDEIKHPQDRITQISNTNKLIKFYKGCDGGKTGYTNEAGHCLVASANRENMRLICVVINSPDSKTRFNDVSSMFNYGFANYVNKIIIDKNQPLNLNVTIKGAKNDKIELVAEKNVWLFSKKNQKRSVEIDFVQTNFEKAPVKKGEKIGELHIFENNIQIDCINVLVNQKVEQKNYFDFIVEILDNWSIA